MQLSNHHRYPIWNFKMGSLWETSPFTGKQRERTKASKGINLTQNLTELSGKSIYHP